MSADDTALKLKSVVFVDHSILVPSITSSSLLAMS